MNRVQSKKTGPQKALLKRLIWNAQMHSLPTSEVTQCSVTVAIHCTKGPSLSAQAECTPGSRTMTHTLVHRLDITPSALDLRTLPQIQRPHSTETHSQRPKHTQQEQKETEDGFQKGLVTSRSNPGLFTHHFNTAANCNRLTSAHMTKWKKAPKGKFRKRAAWLWITTINTATAKTTANGFGTTFTGKARTVNTA